MAALDATPTIQVLGTAMVRAEPDEAMLRITLTEMAPTPGEALSTVATRSNSLVALLDSLEIDRADRTTAGVTVSEEFDHTQEGRRPLGHRAATQVNLRLTDAELIGQLVSRAAEELDARLV